MPLAALALLFALDVPFVAQRDETCGPASLAMVLGYWGDTATHDELATVLVVPGGGGVQGSRLAALAEARGFRAVAFEGDLALVEDYMARAWPLVVALDAGKGRFHDVVVVGVEKDAVVVHDPALGPLRRIRLAEFTKKWGRSGRWTLLLLPEKAK